MDVQTDGWKSYSNVNILEALKGLDNVILKGSTM